MPTASENFDQWSALAGLRCICFPGCTDRWWGDGPPHPSHPPFACRPECVPCKRMKGKPYHPPPGSKRKQK